MTKKNTKKLIIGAMLSALSVAAMLVGAFLEVLDLSVGVIASGAVIFALLELRGSYPVMIWLSSGILSLLLLPNKLPAVYFLLFFGWYPIAKLFFERLIFPLCWALKILCFCVSAVSMYFIGNLIVPIEDMIGWAAPVLLVLSVAVFVLYDIALSRIILSYVRVWRHRLKIKI